ncbi:MAG: hypothetical protein ABFE13_08640 [Phycisphaerales bacterium]
MSSIQHSLLVLLTLSAGFVARCGQAADTAALFADMQFRRGFLLSYPDSSRGRAVEAVLHLGDANNVPVWRLCQWATKYSLAAVPCVRGDTGDLSYENEGKRVVVGGPGSQNRDLILDIHGKTEYGATARKQGESWPHLLVEQDAPVLYPLDELDGIRLAICLRLLRCTNHTPPEQYDPGLHAAQFQMFFIVKNTSLVSQDRGNYFWFGVPFFDSRCDVPPAYMAQDAGKGDATGKFIYTVDARLLGITSLQGGDWISVQADLLPLIRSGLQEAVKRGYLKDAALPNYAVVNMNLGWEIPGTFDAAIQVRDLSISATIR